MSGEDLEGIGSTPEPISVQLPGLIPGLSRKSIPEREALRLMAGAIDELVSHLPEWRRIPVVATIKGNYCRALIAGSMAWASGLLLESASRELDADVDSVLDYQARTACEFFFDVAWLRLHDADGRLSDQYLIWKIVSKSKSEDDVIRAERRRYGDRLDNPDGWTVAGGGVGSSNPDVRRQAVLDVLMRNGLGFSGIMSLRFVNLISPSHGVVATLGNRRIGPAGSVMLGCYIAVQECHKWLLDVADGAFPNEETEQASRRLDELVGRLLTFAL